MPRFTKISNWRFADNGDIEFKFETADNRSYETAFSREAAVLLALHAARLLGTTIDQFPDGLKELVEALLPKALMTVVLPNGQPALEITTNADLVLPFGLSTEGIAAIRGALIDAESILNGPTIKH